MKTLDQAGITTKGQPVLSKLFGSSTGIDPPVISIGWQAAVSAIKFKDIHYPRSVILNALFFYLRYDLSYRDLEEILEQHHRFIKRNTHPMMGFKAFHSSAAIAGIEAAHMIRTGQIPANVASVFQIFAGLTA